MKLHTVFEWCNDIGEMRAFYTDALGMTETHARDDADAAVVVYQAGDTQIVITRSPETKAVLEQWTKTWGFEEGVLNEPAWVIEVDWDSFFETVARLRKLGGPTTGSRETRRRSGRSSCAIRWGEPCRSMPTRRDRSMSLGERR